jgi:tRNA U34 5-methylaminomethyl-2-thiouridine-forming methyltransferase MnmC
VTEGNNSNRQLELKVTGDGSHTLFVPGLNEHFHSVFGAIAESRHIFLDAGFKYICRTSETISILEIGFGTGLNAWLTYIESENLLCKVEYTAIELNPLKEDIYSKLNFPEILDKPESKKSFLHIHELPWNIPVQLSTDFSLHKINTSQESYQPQKDSFDLVYFDAFGPDVQPEMWTKEVFDKMAFGLRRGGVLVTYSTKGSVKRNLLEAGFSLEKLPGPQGKREILRAIRI